MPPQVPTGLLPANNSIVTNSDFVVAATLAPNIVRQKLQWQVASDGLFTVGLRTLDSPYSNPGALASKAGTPRIPQGSAYIRVRTIEEGTGLTSAWSGANQVTVQHPSSASLIAPGPGASIPWTGTQVFTWNFSDTSSLDIQTAYRVLLEVSPDDSTYTNLAAVYNSYNALRSANSTYANIKAPPVASTIYDSGKIFSPLGTHTAVLPGAAKNRLVRWSVVTWDNDDRSAGPSRPNLLLMADLPLVSITGPLGAIGTPLPTVTWTYTSPAGSGQFQYRVRFTNAATGTLIFDSGLITGAGTTYTPPSPILQHGIDTVIAVTVVSANGMQSTATTTVTPNWAAPPNPSFTIDTYGYENSGFVFLEWNGAPRDATFIRWKIYRRNDIYSDWVLAGTTTVDDFLDYGAPPLPSVQYAVTQEGLMFGELVESTLIPITVDLTVNSYMIAVEGEPGTSIRLYNVTGDEFEIQREAEVMDILGVGRKAEVGTMLGAEGTLKVQLRDMGTTGHAGAQYDALVRCYEENKVCVLRIPFGRVLRIHLGDMGAERIPGTGRSELMDVSIPYTEVV